MNTRNRKPNSHLYLWLETGAFFFFSVALSSLTILGGLGVNPFDSNPPQVQQVSRWSYSFHFLRFFSFFVLCMSYTVTKAQALIEFRECVGRSYDHDRIMKREAWINFVDSLRRDGLVSNHQYTTWSNPFWWHTLAKKITTSWTSYSPKSHLLSTRLIFMKTIHVVIILSLNKHTNFASLNNESSLSLPWWSALDWRIPRLERTENTQARGWWSHQWGSLLLACCF